MASEQERRDNVVNEREVKVEKDRVPKMTSHFESMAERSKDSDTQKQQQSHHQDKAEDGGTGTHFVSLEDIHGYRANAQQKSMDTIRAAEERYNKAKESLSHGGEQEEVEGK